MERQRDARYSVIVGNNIRAKERTKVCGQRGTIASRLCDNTKRVYHD